MQSARPAGPERRGARAEVHSVRTRVVAALLVMVTAGMVIAGMVSYLVQRAAIDRAVRSDADQELAELTAIAAAPDPATGKPFTSVEEVLEAYLRSNLPGSFESLGGMIDGQLRFVGADQSLDLRTDQAVLDIGRAATGTDRASVTDVESAAGLLRVTTIPVTVTGDPARGVLLVVHDIGDQRAELAAWARTYALITLGTVVVAGLVGAIVAGRLLRPLRDLALATEITTWSDFTRRVEVGDSDDEVSHLARTFNDMLDRLEEAFAAQRRFLDDAGHELRTPIAIVRGHLEVLDAADVADVVATRELVLDELDRMQRLVEDLILLSRARRPDFLRLTEVDLTTFTDEVFERVRYLGPQRWVLDSQASGQLLADPQRLTQAVAQLAANAAKFCPPDSTIRIGSRWSVERPEWQLWVADDGPGIDPAEHERIFARFARASSGRGVEGSGLGLSIVAAVAEAHGGRVEVVSAPGRGTTFTLVIPARLGSRTGATRAGLNASDGRVGS